MKSESVYRLVLNRCLILTLFTCITAFAISAQVPDDIDELREQAARLLEQDRFVEAVPLLEKIVAADPEDGSAQFYYGFSLIAQASGMTDKEAAKPIRIKARQALVKAKELDVKQTILDSLISSIPEDGSWPFKFSQIAAADELMTQGESAFTQGKYDEAIVLYKKALVLDPTLYEAALFLGDMYLKKESYDEAEIWYQKAIAIDPNRETAYRYSATPLMKQKKYDKARDRYVEAFIVEPYSKLARSGFLQWGEATKTRLAHPRIDIPKYEVGEDGKVNTTITLSPEGDGSIAWIGYSAERGEWRESKFAAEFPNETEYRHSLKEEAAALRNVILLAKELKGKKSKLNPQLETLIELDKKGLLEAYILLAIPDNGIAQDYDAYLKNNRAKLRQYMMEYVIQK